MSDEFLGILERRVIRRHFDLRENGHDIARAPRFAQRVLQRLLQHVTDPAGGARDENAKRKRRHFAARFLVAHQLVTNLRSISVDYDDAPSIEREVHYGSEARSAVAELIANRRMFARRRKRVPPNGDYRGARSLAHLCGPINAPRESYATPNAFRSAAARAALIRL